MDSARLPAVPRPDSAPITPLVASERPDSRDPFGARLLPRLPLLVAVAVVVGCGVYLVAAGERPGLPMFFLVAAALVLCASVYLLGRSVMAMLREPPVEELRLATGRRRKELEREKQALLKALKELAFDHEMHKISDEDFREFTARYRARATRVMRQLDEGASDVAARIERDLAALRAGGMTTSLSPAATSAPTQGACAVCGTVNDSDADFCKRCGGRVGAGEAAAR